MKLGVKRGTVTLEAYTSDWQKAYEQEKTILLAIFGDHCLAIEHVGSTSIPNLIAKPLIDIAIKVINIDALNDIAEGLISIGYEERVGRLSGRQKVFAKGGDLLVTHHLHIIEEGVIDWEEKIRFRNVLISNGDLVKEYSELKRALILKYKEDRLKYTKSKALFITKVLSEK